MKNMLDYELFTEGKLIGMKDIEGYEGLYAITIDGRVWSFRNNKFLKPDTSYVSGYRPVILYKNGKGKKFDVRRLVKTYFNI